MAQTYSTELAGIDAVPSVKPSATAGYGARNRRYRATIALAGQASGDTIVLADLPAGVSFAIGMINSTVTLGTSTVAIGTVADPVAFRAAATFTTADTPSSFGKALAVAGAALVAPTRVLLTIGAAALPASGTLVVDLVVSSPN